MVLQGDKDVDVHLTLREALGGMVTVRQPDTRSGDLLWDSTPMARGIRLAHLAPLTTPGTPALALLTKNIGLIDPQMLTLVAEWPPKERLAFAQGTQQLHCAPFRLEGLGSGPQPPVDVLLTPLSQIIVSETGPATVAFKALHEPFGVRPTPTDWPPEVRVLLSARGCEVGRGDTNAHLHSWNSFNCEVYPPDHDACSVSPTPTRSQVPQVSSVPMSGQGAARQRLSLVSA